ncbi:hypothetical protein [Nonomuraea sp. NPDC003709]|uniref:hypothetical protein n=1 Tax=Nonomuraea sp. NPDC003709 TaxID=3154450 RepID=UPI00339F7BFA
MIMVHRIRVLHWLVHAMQTALIAGLFAFCVARELGAQPLAALGAGGSTFVAVSMGFAAFLTATGTLKEPALPATGSVRPPTDQDVQ